MEYIISIIIGYLLGCSHMSFYLSKIKKIDIKSKGSKNYGASNTMALLGWKYGILTGFHDITKSIIAILIVKYLYPNNIYLPLITGVCCVLGHIYPFYLHFDGGKGFASYVGLIFAINWKFGIIMAITIILITLITDYIVLATFTTITITPISIAIIYQNIYAFLLLLPITIIIFIKHKENILRLKNGTEMKLSKANKKEYR